MTSTATNLQVKLELSVQGTDFYGKGLPRLFSAERWHLISHYVRNGIARNVRCSDRYRDRRYRERRTASQLAPKNILTQRRHFCGPPLALYDGLWTERETFSSIHLTATRHNRETRIFDRPARITFVQTADIFTRTWSRYLMSCLTREFHTWSNIWYFRDVTDVHKCICIPGDDDSFPLSHVRVLHAIYLCI